MDDLLPGMLDLVRDGDETLTRQLTDQLRILITKGRLAPGQRLPSSRQLAQSLGLSRNTASFAIEQLAAEGYVTLSAGRRPVVAEGLSLDRRKSLPRNIRAASERINLSAWASSLQRSVWPPIHKERPRPFQPVCTRGLRSRSGSASRSTSRVTGATSPWPKRKKRRKLAKGVPSVHSK